MHYIIKRSTKIKPNKKVGLKTCILMLFLKLMWESILQMWCRREFQRSGATQLKALKPSVVGWAGGIMGLTEQQDLRIQKGVMMCRRSERVVEVGNSADSLAPHRVGINRLACVCGFDFTVNELIWKQPFRFHVLLFDLTRSDGSCSLFES